MAVEKQDGGCETKKEEGGGLVFWQEYRTFFPLIWKLAH